MTPEATTSLDPHGFSPELPIPNARCQVCGLTQRMCELTYRPRPVVTPDQGQTSSPLRRVLAAHEITRIEFHLSTVGGTVGNRSHPSGFWVPIAYCKCGHTSPPELRGEHLAISAEREMDDELDAVHDFERHT